MKIIFNGRFKNRRNNLPHKDDLYHTGLPDRNQSKDHIERNISAAADRSDLSASLDQTFHFRSSLEFYRRQLSPRSFLRSLTGEPRRYPPHQRHHDSLRHISSQGQLD